MKRLILLIPLLSAAAAAQVTCTLASLKGTYAVSYMGWLSVVEGSTTTTYPGTILGVISIGWDGKLSGGDAVAGFGPVVDYDIAGTVELKSDCTGTLHIKSQPRTGGQSETEVHRFVYNESKKTMYVAMVDLGPGVYPAIPDPSVREIGVKPED